jgi:Rod binding domain-containing protein
MSVTPVSPHAATALASLSGGGNPKVLAGLPPAEQTRAVAGQFEAIMVRQLLQQSMGNLMGGEEGGPAGGIYGYLLTDVLASKLTEGGGLGLAGMLQKQLTPGTAGSAGEAEENSP